MWGKQPFSAGLGHRDRPVRTPAARAFLCSNERPTRRFRYASLLNPRSTGERLIGENGKALPGYRTSCRYGLFLVRWW